MTIKVERGRFIPKPDRGRKRKYPWHDMEVGDSFAIPVAIGETLQTAQNRLTVAAYYRNRRYGEAYTTRCQQTDDGWEIRIWRTK